MRVIFFRSVPSSGPRTWDTEIQYLNESQTALTERIRIENYYYDGAQCDSDMTVGADPASTK